MSATLGTHVTGKGAFWLLEAVMTVVGRVAALWRYPVKSMAGERVDAADVSWHGLAGDRRWAFIRDGQVRSGFPWLTIRELPELAHYRPGSPIRSARTRPRRWCADHPAGILT
jgi:uncharacterized protein YcbX